MSDTSNKPAWLQVATLTTLFVALLYTTGWSYAYHYFEQFHVGLIGLEIPKEYFFLYSYLAVKSQTVLFIVCFIGFVGIFVLGKYVFQKAEEKIDSQYRITILRLVPVMLVPLMIFILFAIFYHIGDKAAKSDFDNQLKHDFRSYPRVRVWIKTPVEAEYGDAMRKVWETGCYRLLMRNKDHLFLFYPEQKNNKMPTDIIPAGQVEMVRILPQYHSCTK